MSSNMGTLLFWTVRGVVALIQALPLVLAARLGRALGSLAWGVDRRHRRVALQNLHQALSREHSREELHAIAKENFRRIGENYVCAIKTAGMSNEALRPHLTLQNIHEAVPSPGQPCIAAIGHFGNFELFARINRDRPGWQLATTYRALRPPGLNRVLQSLRRKSGALFFERTRDAEAVRAALATGHVTLGLLSDQHAGDRGLWLPFFGTHCSTSPAPAVYALRLNVPVIPAFCFRTGLAQWRIEAAPPIPTRTADGTPREVAEIMVEVNRAFEHAIRRDPANWFWVHRRWKPASTRQRKTRELPTPSGLQPGQD